MFVPLLGYFLILLVSFCVVGKDALRRDRDWKCLAWGISLQILVVWAMMNVSSVVSFFECVANGILVIRDATLEGTKFVFGFIGGEEPPFQILDGKSSFILAFQGLPTVILCGMLAAILTYLKVLPVLARIVGYPFRKIFKVKESIGMVAAARIFIGQLESPLLIKHELEFLKKSDIFIILTLAFATSSAAVMPLYASAIEAICPAAMKHIIMSSVISVISALIVCSIISPSFKEDEDLSSTPANSVPDSLTKPYGSFMGALSKGLSDGCFVWWCIVGSMIGMVALIALVNHILDLLPNVYGNPLTLQSIFGFIMYPFAWLIGIQDADLFAVSQVLGTKLAVNEIVAYFDLAKSEVSQDSVIKAIYAITNFGNFSCIGVTVGGMAAIAPSQKCIPALIGKAFIAGLLATGLSASIVGVFLSF
jgi:CNT family concentrative nucleoside transporter